LAECGLSNYGGTRLWSIAAMVIVPRAWERMQETQTAPRSTKLWQQIAWDKVSSAGVNRRTVAGLDQISNNAG
jgi:hypothetical protein